MMFKKLVNGLVLTVLMVLLAVFVVGLSQVSVKSPASNAYVSGTLVLNATGQNDTQNMTWQFYNSAGSLAYNFSNATCINITASNTIGCSLAFNSNIITDGIYSIVANATNATNLTGVTNTSTNVTIDNTAPVTTLSSPTDAGGQLANTDIAFNWTAVDGFDTIINCSLLINNTYTNVSINRANNTVSGAFVRFATNGTRYWNVTCSDSGGNTAASSSTRSFTIDGTNPVVSFSAPTSGATVGGTFTVTTTATDDVSLSTVTVEVINASNNTNIVATAVSLTNSAGSTWTGSIASGAYSDNNYTLRANATDTAGNRATTTRNISTDNTAPTITSFTLTDDEVLVDEDISGSCLATDTSGEVSKSITGIDTSSAGSKTATCTATDAYGNSATATASYTVTARSGGSSSGGGGGSGGSGGTTTPGSTGGTGGAMGKGASVEVDLEGGKVITIDLPETSALDMITITPGSSLGTVVFTVRESDTAPLGVDALTGHDLFKYVHVDESELVSVSSAEISFSVDVAWLAAHGDAVSLYRWDGTSWKEFKATLKSKDATSGHFVATVSGLSYYAIGSSTGAVTPEAAAPAAETTPTEVTTPPAKEGRSPTLWLALVVIIVVVIAFFIYRKNARKQ